MNDKQIAWTLGIGWACCGGGLAGMCLVFAKAAVKLITGSLSHENTGNQFGRVSSIFTFVFLAITAVAQIICLNRGLRVYDSTLVVPVFYGVYTAAGFVNSMVFNNSVDAYQTWVLFLIFISIMTLISGVVLLTLKKPKANGVAQSVPADGSVRSARETTIDHKTDDPDEEDEGENSFASSRRRNTDTLRADETVWQVGDVSDDEDEGGGDVFGGRRSPFKGGDSVVSLGKTAEQVHPGEEGVGLMHGHDLDEEYENENVAERLANHRRSMSSDATLAEGSGSRLQL